MSDTIETPVVAPVQRIDALELVEGHVLRVSPATTYENAKGETKSMARVMFVPESTGKPELLSVYGKTVAYAAEAEGKDGWCELRHMDNGGKMLTQVIAF